MADDNPFADLLTSSPRQQTSPDNPFADLLAPKSEPAPKPEVSATDAFGRGLTQSASFGFLDELAGTIAAGGAGPNENPAATIAALGRGAYRRLTGDPEAARVAEAETARVRAQNKQFEEAQPEASLGGTLTGAVAVPIGYAARVPQAVAGAARAIPTIWARTRAAAQTGAVQGGLTGLGEGEGTLGERLPGAVVGSGIGAVAGGVLSPVIGGVGYATRQILSPVTNLVQAWRAGQRPAEAALQRVGTVAQRDIAAGDVGLTAPEFAEAAARGQPVTMLERMGETGRAQARAAANASPEARIQLNRAIDDRFEGQGGRFASWLDRTFNHPNAPAQQLAQREEARLVNVPNYQRAYDAGDRPIWSPELERLTAAPSVADAGRGAMSRWRDFQVNEGYGAVNPPFNVTPDGRLEFTNSAGAPVFPNIQFWDYAARTLGEAAQAARGPGGVATTRSTQLGGLERQLKSELDRLVPEYGHARADARTFFGEQNAVRAGENFVGRGERLGLKQARIDYDRMTPEQQALFADGYASRMVDVATSVRDRRNLLQRFDTSDAQRVEMRMALGPRRAAETEAFLRVEEVMDRARGAVQGNSTTIRQAIEDLAFGTGVGAFTADSYTDPSALAYGVAAAGARTGARRLAQTADQRVMGEVARLLTSRNPADYDRAVQMVASKPSFMEAVRKITSPIGDQITGTATGRAAGTLTAEREQ